MLIRSLAVSLIISSIAGFYWHPGQSSAGPHSLDYDASAPLDIKQAGVEERGEVGGYDISYASPRGGRVPAYLVVPSGTGPFAAVIWGHWYWENSEFRNRKEFLAEAVALAHAGVVSLLTDGPVARPGHVEEKAWLSDQNAEDLMQQIVDMRQGRGLVVARQGGGPRRRGVCGAQDVARMGRVLGG